MKQLYEIELLKQAIDEKKIPRYLYKYRSLESAHQFISNHQVMFSPFERFNDPFDCGVNLDCRNTEEEWIKYLMMQGASEPDAKAIVASTFSTPGKMEEIVRGAITKIMHEVGIFCLSARKDSIYMWSHYANEHHGVCLEFDILADLRAFCFPKKVIYGNDYPNLNYIQAVLAKSPEIMAPLWHKSADWDKEDEYRVIAPEGVGLKEINRQALSGVIFGCRCSDSDRDTIKEALAIGEYESTILYEARQNESAYKLDIMPI